MQNPLRLQSSVEIEILCAINNAHYELNAREELARVVGSDVYIADTLCVIPKPVYLDCGTSRAPIWQLDC